MQKTAKSYRFGPSTLDQIKKLKEEFGIDNETLLLETLIDQAHERIHYQKIKDTTPPDLLEILTRNGIYLENVNNVLWMNGKTSHYNAAKYDVHVKLHKLGFQQVEKLFQEIMDFLIPGYLKRENIK